MVHPHSLPSLPLTINSTQYLGFLLDKIDNNENPDKIRLETLYHTALYPHTNDPEEKLIIKELNECNVADFSYKNVKTQAEIEAFLEKLGFKHLKNSKEWHLRKRKSFFNDIKETFQTYGSKEGQCRIL